MESARADANENGIPVCAWTDVMSADALVANLPPGPQDANVKPVVVCPLQVTETPSVSAFAHTTTNASARNSFFMDFIKVSS
jgi:hypothetical protein